MLMKYFLKLKWLLFQPDFHLLVKYDPTSYFNSLKQLFEFASGVKVNRPLALLQIHTILCIFTDINKHVFRILSYLS